MPLVLASGAFDVWMIDEIDFQRFVGRKDIGYRDIKAASRDYPNEIVKELSRALVSVMDDAQSDKPLSGEPLHDALFDALDREVSDVRQVWDSLKAVELETRPWSSKSPLPMNFPMFLVPVFLDEFRRMALNRPLNPRIHILRDRGAEPVVRVWWRKDLLDAEEGPDVYYLPVTWVLDATADAELLGRCLSMDYIDIEAEDDRQPEWPKNVEVGQWKSDLVTMSTIGIGWHNNPNARERWYRRVLSELEPLQGDHAAHKIGVITHKVIEEELVERIRGAGFQNVVFRHYGDERGSNEMEDAHILVLLGLPIPNIDEFQQEAQAFFYDEATLDFEWSERKEKLQMADGSTTEVGVGGYWQQPVARYYRQKCQSDLYQALHRIRPYNPQPYDRHILIFTNMPIDGVVVDRLMIGEREATTGNRFDRAVDFIIEQVDPSGEATKKALVRHLKPSEKAKTLSIDAWVKRESATLAAATDTVFMPRVVGGEPARFVRADDGGGSEK